MTSVRGAVLGGLIAGTIDIGAASLINAVNPLIILRAIASGVLGTASFRMGTAAAMLGLLLQWAMSLLIAAIFAVAAGRLPMLRRHWLAGGLSYGVVIYFVMNFLVVPLSAAVRSAPFSLPKAVENMLAMLLFGLIVSFYCRQKVARRPS